MEVRNLLELSMKPWFTNMAAPDISRCQDDLRHFLEETVVGKILSALIEQTATEQLENVRGALQIAEVQAERDAIVASARLDVLAHFNKAGLGFEQEIRDVLTERMAAHQASLGGREDA